MTYKIKLGRDAASYGNVVAANVFHAINIAGNHHPDIADVVAVARNDPDPVASQEASDLLARLPVGAYEWLRDCGSAYRVSANWLWKKAPPSFATSIIGQDCVTYGYVLDVHFDDRSQALLFKLTFGGSL